MPNDDPTFRAKPFRVRFSTLESNPWKYQELATARRIPKDCAATANYHAAVRQVPRRCRRSAIGDATKGFTSVCRPKTGGKEFV